MAYNNNLLLKGNQLGAVGKMLLLLQMHVKHRLIVCI